MKKVSSLMLALALCLALSAPVMASNASTAGYANTIGTCTGQYGDIAFLDESGALWLWEAFEGAPVKLMENVASFSKGGDMVIAAVKTDGSLWIWSGNAYGQRGDGTLNVDEDGMTGSPWYEGMDGELVEPVKVMDGVTAVSTNDFTVAAIKTDGSLWVWGANFSLGLTSDECPAGNALGLGTGVGDARVRVNLGGVVSVVTYSVQTKPVKLMDGVASVCIGRSAGAAVKTDGSLWMWGYNDGGQLGVGGSGKPHQSFAELVFEPQPTPVKVLDGIASVSVGVDSTAAVKTDGSLWTWGCNVYGQLGNGGGGNASYVYEDDWWERDPVYYQTVPAKVMDGVASVSVGVYSTAAVKTDGSLWVCGYSFLGSLGVPGDADSWGNLSVRTPVKLLDGVAAVDMANQFLALKTDGSLLTWGDNNWGSRNKSFIPEGDFITNPTLIPGYKAKVPGPFTVSAPVEPEKPVSQEQPQAPTEEKLEVIPTNQRLTVNGAEQKTEIYNINGANYFKLRDVAALLNGTGSQFSVDFDGATNTVVVRTGAAYTRAGGELMTGTDKSASTVKSAQKLQIDGKAVDLPAYNIGGNNFFGLRDLGNALGFDVDYDSATATMIVKSRL